MKSSTQNDPVLHFFKTAAAGSLGTRLREVLLFGSRARGDATAESDYDLLVVVDKVDPSIVRGIDDIAGRALLDYGAVVSAFPIAEEDRARRRYSPLLINVAREGVAVADEFVSGDAGQHDDQGVKKPVLFRRGAENS